MRSVSRNNLSNHCREFDLGPLLYYSLSAKLSQRHFRRHCIGCLAKGRQQFVGKAMFQITFLSVLFGVFIPERDDRVVNDFLLSADMRHQGGVDLFHKRFTCRSFFAFHQPLQKSRYLFMLLLQRFEDVDLRLLPVTALRRLRLTLLTLVASPIGISLG